MKKRKGELKKKTLLTIGLELRFHKLSCSRSGGWSANEKGGRKTTQERGILIHYTRSQVSDVIHYEMRNTIF